MAVALKFVALLIITFVTIKRPSFVSSNSVCYSFRGEYVQDIQSCRINASIWVYKQQSKMCMGCCSHGFMTMLLLLCGDVETCPGPRATCCSCDKLIRKNQNVERCLVCDKESHLKCLVDEFNSGHEKLFCRHCVGMPGLQQQDGSTTTPTESPYIELNSFLKARGFKVFHQNVNGLLHKLTYIELMMKETINTFDILGITETHLHEGISDEELKVDGYTFIRKDRKNSAGGGVGCYVRADIGWQRRKDLENDDIEAIWLEIFVKKSCSILIGIIYRPPNTSSYLSSSFKSSFNDMLDTCVSEDKETIVIGDLNVNYSKNSDNTEIKRIIKQYGLKQIIKKPTRITKSSSTLIDIIATTHEKNISKHITCGNSISDHDLTGVIIKKNNLKFPHRIILKRNYAKYNKQCFIEDLHNQSWNAIEREIDLNKAWDCFKNILRSVIDKHVPIIEKKVRGKNCPWLSNEIKTKMNERDHYLKKARKSGKELDWSTYRHLRNDVTRMIRNGKANYTRSILRENINRPSDFWSQIKRIFPTKTGRENTSTAFKIDGENISETKVIADKFCSFFTYIGKTLQKSLPQLVNPIWRNHDYNKIQKSSNPNKATFAFMETNHNEVKTILKKLNKKKSSGYDEIPISPIVDGAFEIATPLTYLINRSMRESVFPSSEKCAKVIPIYKSGEKCEMDNYRPISVLPVFSKVIERVVYEQLYSYLEANKLLSDRQFGFRQGSSTQHAVTILVDSIRQNMDKGLMTGAVFLDLRKAFDTVDHSRIISKLPLYGIRGIELAWMESYLFDRKQFVHYDGNRSQTQHIPCGVPQGSILGPLLFIILINDIGTVLKQCEHILYADDTVLYTSGKLCEDIQRELNDDLDLIANWLGENNLIVNLKKTKTECVLFGTHQKTSKAKPMEIKMKGVDVTESTSYEYLGVTMDKSLTFARHLKKVIKKASSRTNLLNRIRHNISPYTAKTIYKVMILPVMLYCSNVFINIADSKKQNFENIQRRALRIVNGQNNSVQLPTVQQIRNKICAVDVFKCLNGLAPSVYKDYFTRTCHLKNTRGNNKNLVLPKIRSESGRKSFAFYGAKIFNSLPNDLKTETSILFYKTNLNSIDLSF